MQILRMFLALFLLTGFFFIPNQKVLACTCVFHSMENARISASEIFVGRVVAMEKIPNLTRDFVPNDTRVTFFVTTIWKGARVAVKRVASNLSSASCGYEFEMGREYFVIAYGAPQELNTGLCAGTRQVDLATKDLAALGKGKQVKAAKNKAYWLPASIATRRNEFWNCRKNVVCQRATMYACQVFSGTPGIRVFCR